MSFYSRRIVLRTTAVVSPYPLFHKYSTPCTFSRSTCFIGGWIEVVNGCILVWHGGLMSEARPCRHEGCELERDDAIMFGLRNDGAGYPDPDASGSRTALLCLQTTPSFGTLYKQLRSKSSLSLRCLSTSICSLSHLNAIPLEKLRVVDRAVLLHLCQPVLQTVSVRTR